MSTSPANTLPKRPPEYAEWPPQPYWPTFVEKLLLALIDANAPRNLPQSERQARLDTALQALFGVVIPSGPKPLYDLPAQVKIARDKLVADSLRAADDFFDLPLQERTRSPSHRAAAAAAEHLASGNSPTTRQETLRKSVRKGPIKEYLTQIALHGFHAEEEDMMRDLQEIARVLRRWNTPLEADPRKLGMASLWGETPPNNAPDGDPKVP